MKIYNIHTAGKLLALSVRDRIATRRSDDSGPCVLLYLFNRRRALFQIDLNHRYMCIEHCMTT